MKRFVLIGAAGYVAERHIRAIKETGNILVATLDPFDVMGRIDAYFPEAEFFQREEELERFLQQERAHGRPVDYVSICSPNYLHVQHIELALRNNCHVLCEKPLVIYPSDLDTIQQWEQKSGKRVYTVLQLRYHPVIKQFKEEIECSGKERFDIDLKYITSRGKWYYKSWKGDVQKSGGIAINIGIHSFDMLIWIFGNVIENRVLVSKPQRASGELVLERAKVRWELSLDPRDLPRSAVKSGKRTFRSIRVDGREIEFSEGFTDLHTETYRQILMGNGFGVDDTRESLLLVEKIRIGE